LRLGEYLVNRGIVQEADVYDALDYQQRNRVPIGALALKKKLLTMKQVMTVLNQQCDTNKLFGEMAVQLGLLQEKDVEDLLEEQRKLCLPIGEILLKLNRIDAKTLDRELTGYFDYVATQKKT